MAPVKVDADAESSISLFSLLLSGRGSALSIVACAILFFRFWVYPCLPPMSPNALVQRLRGTVEETIALFREHGRLLLVNVADINIQLIRLEADTCALERTLLDANQRVSLTSWNSLVFYLQQAKYIWINAHRYQRKINALKSKMEIVIIQDREGKLRDVVACRRSGLSMDHSEGEAPRLLCRQCSGCSEYQVE